MLKELNKYHYNGLAIFQDPKAGYNPFKKY